MDNAAQACVPPTYQTTMILGLLCSGRKDQAIIMGAPASLVHSVKLLIRKFKLKDFQLSMRISKLLIHSFVQEEEIVTRAYESTRAGVGSGKGRLASARTHVTFSLLTFHESTEHVPNTNRDVQA